MDIIKLTRELGAQIQKDERYLRFDSIRRANENDAVLRDLTGQIQLVQMNYQRETQAENPDDKKISEYEKQFDELYNKFMSNEKMQAYEEARQEIDSMMNYIMQILSLCVNGADPATCEPQEHECNGSCSHCSGC